MDSGSPLGVLTSKVRWPVPRARLSRAASSLALLPLLMLLPGALHAQPGPTLQGTYTFIQDSDGNKAPANVAILLTFSNGNVTLVSSPPQPQYTDSGTYQFQAGTLQRLVLPHLGKFVLNGKVSQQGNALTLPFKLLSGGPGSSSWQAPAQAGPASCGDDEVRALVDQILTRETQRVAPQVQAFLRRSITPGANEAVAWTRLGTALNLAGYVPEAAWALAHAAKLLLDPHILNNLAHVLNLEADYVSSRKILQNARCHAPQNPFVVNNLAYANYQMTRYDEAEMAERNAIALSPQPEYYWSLCKILNAQHRTADAKPYCDQAEELGIVAMLHPGAGQGGKGGGGAGGGSGSGAGGAGSGAGGNPPRPDEPPGPDQPPPGDNRPDLKPPSSNDDANLENAPDADPESNIYGQIGKRDRAHDQKPPKPYNFPSNPGPLAKQSKAAGEWVGHWEGYKVTGCIKRTRNFGSGVSTTKVHEDICHYAQNLSFDVGEDGRISGEGEAVYVFYGKADMYATMMLPLPMPPGGFFATFPGGYRVRKFKVEGVVTPDGTVYIGGRPDKPMFLLNVYMFQKIYGWNVFPPPPNDPAKPGILHIGKQGNFWTMEAKSLNQVSGMNYETEIFKTNEKFDMVKGCKIYCQEKPLEGKTSAKLDDVKCEVSAGPVTIEGNEEELGVKVNMAGVTLNAGANYGKPGDIQKLIKAEGESGCGGLEDESLSKVGTESVGASAAGFGFSNERNPITGDETFSLGVEASTKIPGVDLGHGATGNNALNWSFKLVADSHCGFGAKFALAQKTGVKEGAEGELGGMKVGASCSGGETTTLEATAWAADDIVE